jgi:hypothetical protein
MKLLRSPLPSDIRKAESSAEFNENVELIMETWLLRVSTIVPSEALFSEN